MDRACEDADAPGLKKRGWPPAPPPAAPLEGTKNCAAAKALLGMLLVWGVSKALGLRCEHPAVFLRSCTCHNFECLALASWEGSLKAEQRTKAACSCTKRAQGSTTCPCRSQLWQATHAAEQHVFPSAHKQDISQCGGARGSPWAPPARAAAWAPARPGLGPGPPGAARRPAAPRPRSAL